MIKEQSYVKHAIKRKCTDRNIKNSLDFYKTNVILVSDLFFYHLLKVTNNLTLFEKQQIRRIRNEQQEKRFFSVIDIVAILTEQDDYKKSKSYRTTLKSRLKAEGSEVVTNCDQLKMKASDGKFYLTDVADVETIFRLVQSVPSKKAEPIKLRLAKVGNERLYEMVDPSLALNRSREYRKKAGRGEKRIQQRMSGQETRNKLTDYRSTH
jgi:hypothetical protein